MDQLDQQSPNTEPGPPTVPPAAPSLSKSRRQLVQILHERALAFDLLPDVLGHLRSKGNTLDPPAGVAGKLAQETLHMAVEDR